MFFEQFRPTKEGKHPSGELLFLIEQSFGSVETMRELFDKAALSLFGSGWVWLAMNKEGKLEIMPLANADTPLRYQMKPLLTIDMWEHAYYLDYQNRKADYIKNFWMLINWHMISSRING
jgi:Fe-Mn family superoxide dismutase